MAEKKHKALLLMGATGTGKTPFGEQLETQILWGKNYFHFDFGQQLRNAVKRKPEILNKKDIERIDSLLKSNSLLDDSDFHLAEKLLKYFIERNSLSAESDIIILNGLPRHSGQADAIAAIVDIDLVIYFAASPSIIKERIEYNAGGDRTGRTDDSINEIEKKMAIFTEHTAPLIDYYKNLDKNMSVEKAPRPPGRKGLQSGPGDIETLH